MIAMKISNCIIHLDTIPDDLPSNAMPQKEEEILN
jgi:hypothetical protein